MKEPGWVLEVSVFFYRYKKKKNCEIWVKCCPSTYLFLAFGLNLGSIWTWNLLKYAAFIASSKKALNLVTETALRTVQSISLDVCMFVPYPQGMRKKYYLLNLDQYNLKIFNNYLLTQAKPEASLKTPLGLYHVLSNTFSPLITAPPKTNYETNGCLGICHSKRSKILYLKRFGKI